MSRKITAQNRARCERMPDEQLAALIRKLGPKVQRDSSMLDCAIKELQRRAWEAADRFPPTDHAA